MVDVIWQKESAVSEEAKSLWKENPWFYRVLPAISDW